MTLWGWFRSWTAPPEVPRRGYHSALRDRPTKVRRADFNDPLCARPACRVESWDWHRCVMRGPFRPWRVQPDGEPRREPHG
jgi:hypothetical protein